MLKWELELTGHLEGWFGAYDFFDPFISSGRAPD